MIRPSVVQCDRRAALLAAVAASFAHCAAASAADLVLAFDQDALFDRLALEARGPAIDSYGMCYVLYEDDRHIGSFIIAVHATPPERTAWNRVFRVARGADARAAELLEDLGDDRVVWPGRVRVLRRNVTFEVEVNASWERTLSIARAIDDAIQNDPAIAPKGSFEETPRIESAGAPAEVEPLETPAHVTVVTSWATLRPVFKGLGGLEKLHVMVDGLHFSNLTTSIEHSRLIQVRTQVESMETWMDSQPDHRRLRPDEDGRFYCHRAG